MRFNLSIRFKILIVFGFLLMGAVGFYTWLASSVFRQEKTALLYDLNHSAAVNTAAQLRSFILQASNQMRFYLFSELYSNMAGKASAKSLKEAQIVGVMVLKKVGEEFQNIPSTKKVPELEYPIEKVLKHVKEASKGEGYTVWSEEEPAPRLFLGMEISVDEGSEKKFYFLIGEIDRTLFTAPIQAANMFRSYLSNENGEVILGFDKSKNVSTTPITNHPLLGAAVSRSGTTSGVLAFQHQAESWYGAYAPVGVGGLYYLSQANQSEVAGAIKVLIQRSILFGFIVITLTFMVSILFAKSLTKNLRLLNQTARHIGLGKFATNIEIKSGDEIEELALSFNKMIEALRISREAIEKYNRELEEKIALRTKQLHETNATIKEVQEQLVQSAQLAAVGEVAGRTAHEVLNPLTAIASRVERTRTEIEARHNVLPAQFLEILMAWESEFKQGGLEKLTRTLQTPSLVQPTLSLFEEDIQNLKTLCAYWLDEQNSVATSLAFVQEEASRIHRIIDQMRQLVRSSEVRDDVHCHDLLKKAVGTMLDFTKKHGVLLEEEFLAVNDMSHLNQDEFIQIVTNLLRNAYQAIAAVEDFEKNKTGEIKVRTYNESGFLNVEICDNGIGIPKDKIAFVFEQGFTTKGPEEGTGLGLAICRRYARAFGGDVELFSSEPGVGTTFVIRIPLLKSQDIKLAV